MDAGIGGFHKALDTIGGKSVIASETDGFAKKTYRANYNIDLPLLGDIKPYSNDPERIPLLDFLCVGFHYWPISHVGGGKCLDG